MTFRGVTFRLSLAVASVASAAVAANAAASTIKTTTGSGGSTAILQTNAKGSAAQGEVASKVTTSITTPFAILGIYDPSGSGATTVGDGVMGISTTGYGVYASASGAMAAMYATNTATGDGLDVLATGTSAHGVNAESMNGLSAVRGLGIAGDGVSGVTDANNYVGTYGYDASSSMAWGVFGMATSPTGIGTEGYSTTGAGVNAHSESGKLAYPALESSSTTPGTDMYDAFVQGTDKNEYDSMRVSYPSGNYSGTVANSVGASSDLSLNGDIYITGSIYTGCTTSPPTMPSECGSSTSTADVRTSRGGMVRAYEAHAASPTIEDAGEARLVNGYAHVDLDPAFASTLSATVPYLVFPVAEGDCRGLFVSYRTQTGFDVRELGGGRSSVAFGYRIVGHPYDDSAQRLAAVPRSAAQRPVDRHVAATFAAENAYVARARMTENRRTLR